MHRGPWGATVGGVTKSQTRLSCRTCMHLPHTLATEPSLHGLDHTAHVLNLFVVLVASGQGWAVGGGGPDPQPAPSTLSCLPATPPAPGLRPQGSTTCAGLSSQPHSTWLVPSWAPSCSRSPGMTPPGTFLPLGISPECRFPLETVSSVRTGLWRRMSRARPGLRYKAGAYIYL